MTDLQPGDIIRRVHGDSPSWKNGSLHEVTKTNLKRDVDRRFYTDNYELIHRPAEVDALRSELTQLRTENAKLIEALSLAVEADKRYEEIGSISSYNDLGDAMDHAAKVLEEVRTP